MTLFPTYFLLAALLLNYMRLIGETREWVKRLDNDVDKKIRGNKIVLFSSAEYETSNIVEHSHGSRIVPILIEDSKAKNSPLPARYRKNDEDEIYPNSPEK